MKKVSFDVKYAERYSQICTQHCTIFFKIIFHFSLNQKSQKGESEKKLTQAHELTQWAVSSGLGIHLILC